VAHLAPKLEIVLLYLTTLEIGNTMSNADSGLNFGDIDELLNATMDDLDDLPPQGVPPSGHYNLTTTFAVESIGEGNDKKQVVTAAYIVDSINELKDDEEKDEVAVGQQFKEFFHMTKKDGNRNTFGIGTLKQRLAPHAERFGTTNIGELINMVKQVAITASVKRTVNKKNEDQFNMQLKDIVLL
jgi:hypothetical protein